MEYHLLMNLKKKQMVSEILLKMINSGMIATNNNYKRIKQIGFRLSPPFLMEIIQIKESYLVSLIKTGVVWF